MTSFNRITTYNYVASEGNKRSKWSLHYENNEAKDLPVNEADRKDFLSKIAVYVEHSDGEKEILKGEIVEYENGVWGIKIGIKKFSTFTIIQSEALVEKSSQCEITKCIFPLETKMKDSKLSATVKYARTNPKVFLTVSKNATWKLYSDAACKKETQVNLLN